MSKYGNKRAEVDGYTFASKAEARRYQELKLLQQAGEIRDLTIRRRFPLRCPGSNGDALTVSYYEDDFDYWHIATRKRVVEDVKGVRTPVYRLKRKWLKLEYGIDIVEIDA
jgi:hypothetical protein